jgi:hypothetical protein
MPETRYFSGRLIGLFTSVFNIYAITFGRTIFLAPQTIKRDSDGRLKMSGWLVVHECCHVLQYDREGFFRFLFSYVADYFRSLRSLRKFDGNARFQAYASIKQEREADEVEKAYIEWQRRNLFSER